MIRSSRVTPALLTRMSTLPNASRTALTTASAASACEASPWIASARRPSASIGRGRLGGGGGVALVGERHVGALGREAQRRWPARCRASRRSRGRVLPVRSIMRGPPAGVAAGSPGTTSSSGTSTEPGRRISSASASGIGSTESQSTGSRTVTSSGWTAASPAIPRAGSAVHSMVDRAGREAGPERDDDDVVADLDPALVDRLGQGDRHGRGGRVAVLVEVDEHPVHRQVEALGDRLDDPDVGLVRDEQVDVGRLRGRPAGSTSARSSPASGSRTGRSPCPPSGRSARRGRWSRPTAGSSPRRPAARSCRRPAARSSSRCRAPPPGSSDADRTTAPAPSPNRMQVFRSV